MLSTIRRRLPAMGPLFSPMPALLGAIVLSGCGGSPSDDSPKDMYALSQSSVSCDAAPATVCEDVKLYATPINGTTSDFRPGWSERASDTRYQAIDHVYRDLQPDGRWQLSVGFATGLKAGTYTGTIEFGTNPVGDILVPLPKNSRTVSFSYRLVVAGDSISRPLQAVPGAGDWNGWGGNAARTGFVGVTVDPARIKPRWSRPLAGLAVDPLPAPVLTQGQVVLPGLQLEDAMVGDTLTVLSEADGTRVWGGSPIGKPDRVLPAGDRLVVAGAASADGKTTAMAVLARQDGAVRSQLSLDTVDMTDTWARSGDTLVLPDLRGEAVVARSLADLNTVLWSASAYTTPVGSGGLQRWGATIGNGLAYVNVGGRLRGLALTDGTRGVDIAVPAKAPTLLLGTALNQAPVLADATTAVVITHRELRSGEGRDNQLSVVDLASGQVRWTASGRFMDLPVTAGGVVYASNQATKAVEARSLADGSLLWSWTMESGDEYFQRQMVLTNGHLFVSTNRQVVAVDLVTHQAVWRYASAGRLGMSANGTLTMLLDRGSGKAMLVTFDVR